MPEGVCAGAELEVGVPAQSKAAAAMDLLHNLKQTLDPAPDSAAGQDKAAAVGEDPGLLEARVHELQSEKEALQLALIERSHAATGAEGVVAEHQTAEALTLQVRELQAGKAALEARLTSAGAEVSETALLQTSLEQSKAEAEALRKQLAHAGTEEAHKLRDAKLKLEEELLNADDALIEAQEEVRLRTRDSQSHSDLL